MRTTNVSFGPIWPQTIGFENMLREIDDLLAAPLNQNQSFPPHNIIKLDDYKYIVELAIAGFNKQEVTITLKDALLEIKGQKNADDIDVQYIHKGIGTRSFVKAIKLAETVEVQGAEFKDGILRIALENVIPESKKPRQIEITDSLTPSTGIDRVRELLNERDNLNNKYSVSAGTSEIMTDHAKDANHVFGQQYDMDS
jgi:molecular chaperone IbpA